MDTKTCCFIGHSEIRENISDVLTTAVERHIVEYSVTDFLVGHYGMFDSLAARTVIAAKARHPGLHLYLMLPYHPEEGRPLPDREGFDDFIYPEGMEDVPRRWAISQLNRMMVDDSDYVITYVRHSWGGAAKTLEHARAKQKRGELTVTNLARCSI